MSAPQEFHYRLTQRMGGHRPGSHGGTSLGAGLEFATHMSLFDRPDPRRLDVRASLRGVRDEWLVRVNRQRAGIAVHAIVDVSASMSFGDPSSKLHVVANFIEALGLSAFRVGDAFGVLAFDAQERDDLYAPARVSRGTGYVVAERLRTLPVGAGTAAGIEPVVLHLAGKQALVFLVSDFHWPLARLDTVLDLLAHAHVVPIVVWAPSETQPPTRDALAVLHDVESGSQRTIWLRRSVRDRWRDAVAHRREELNELFAARSIRPFYIEGAFEADAMTRYFFEVGL